MFAQVITGRVTDEEGLRRQVQRWQEDVRPGATGYLGTTSGITEDGRVVTLVRFESEDAARRNSERPEQSSWWAEMEKCLSDVEFVDSSDVILGQGGGSDDAAFVQVMRGRIVDTDTYDRMMADIDSLNATLKDARPDVTGMVTVRHDGDRYFDFVYFTSEDEARANEAKELPADARAQMERMMGSVEVTEYFDLGSPDLM